MTEVWIRSVLSGTTAAFVDALDAARCRGMDALRFERCDWGCEWRWGRTGVLALEKCIRGERQCFSTDYLWLRVNANALRSVLC